MISQNKKLNAIETFSNSLAMPGVFDERLDCGVGPPEYCLDPRIE
jgi:hypothetical protein